MGRSTGVETDENASEKWHVTVCVALDPEAYDRARAALEVRRHLMCDQCGTLPDETARLGDTCGARLQPPFSPSPAHYRTVGAHLRWSRRQMRWPE